MNQNAAAVRHMMLRMVPVLSHPLVVSPAGNHTVPEMYQKLVSMYQNSECIKNQSYCIKILNVSKVTSGLRRLPDRSNV